MAAGDQIVNVNIQDVRFIQNASGQIIGIQVPRSGNAGSVGQLRVDNPKGTNITPDAGQYFINTVQDSIAAFSGGGQASATQLTAITSRVTTVAAAADSVKLPVAAPGMDIVVINAHATNSMNVFPSTGDAINALGANTAFAVAAGKTCTFFTAGAGQWHAQLSA